jgi:hypothetical protein
MTRFEELAQEIIKKAEAVDCSLEEFYDGLKDIILALEDRRAVGFEELVND